MAGLKAVYKVTFTVTDKSTPEQEEVFTSKSLSVFLKAELPSLLDMSGDGDVRITHLTVVNG